MCNPRNHSHHRTLAAPLSPRRGEELLIGGSRNQNKRQIFSWTLDRNWHDDAEPFHSEVVTSVTSCYPIIATELRGVWRMMNVHVSPHIITAGWCSDRCLLSPQCDHWQWRDHTSGSINYLTALVTSLGVNNKHNHQDNPQSRAPAPTRQSPLELNWKLAPNTILFSSSTDLAVFRNIKDMKMFSL